MPHTCCDSCVQCDQARRPGSLRRHGLELLFCIVLNPGAPAGYTSFKSLMFITSPIIFVFSTLTTATILLKHVGADMSAYGRYARFTSLRTVLKTYFRITLRACRGHMIPLLYFRSLAPLFMLCWLCMVLILVNGFNPGIYDQSDGCTDPMVKTSIASGNSCSDLCYFASVLPLLLHCSYM